MSTTPPVKPSENNQPLTKKLESDVKNSQAMPSVNVVVQTAFLGDLLLSVPLLKHIKTLWPEDALIVVCRKGVGEFFKLIGLVDEIIEIKKGDSGTYREALKKIKTYHVRNLICPHESWRSVLFCRQIRAERKVSYRKFLKNFFFDELIERDLRLPDPLRQLSLLKGFDPRLAADLEDYAQNGKPYAVSPTGRLPAPPEWASMGWRAHFLSAEAITQFQSLLEKLKLEKIDFKRTVLMFPGSVWATKRWKEEGFVQTAQNLRAQNYEVIVMGGPGEEALCLRVGAQIPGAFCFAGKTSIYESVLLMANARLVICNDSASAHLASLSEVPVLSIFGPTVIEFGYRPWSAQAVLVETLGLPCRPCGPHGHRVCPIGTHVCMKAITAEKVLEKAAPLLADPV